MNWLCLRPWPWLDTRARFVARVPRNGRLLDLGSSDGESLGHLAQLRPDLRLGAADKLGQPDKKGPASRLTYDIAQDEGLQGLRHGKPTGRTR